jgi:hypothetical protein
MGLPGCAVATIALGDPPDTAADTATGDTAPPEETGDTGDTGVPEGCLPFGLTLDERLEMEVNGAVDAWDPSGAADPHPTTLALNRNAECAVRVSDAVLDADVAVAPGQVAPDDVVCTESGGEVTGEVSALDTREPLPFTPLPDGLPASSGAWSLDPGAVRHVVGDLVLDSLDVPEGAEVVVDVPAVVQVTGDVSIGGGAIRLAEGASLALYVDGAFTVEWEGVAGAAGAPERLVVQLSGPGPAWVEIGGVLHGIVVAPSGEVNVSDAQLFGAVAAARARVEWGGALHVDPRIVCGG